MDRGRESRRGGGGGGGGGGSGAGSISGHGASRRRPRSGFKDSSAVCEEEEGLNESHDSTRLRERSSSAINNSNNHKKERSSLSSSKNKRRRPGLPERFHGGGRDRDRERDNEEVDESSEESPVEEEEEDDDEPPHRPLPNPRRTAKFKSQWKVSEETIGVGLDSVPRKARSASVKRPHDSTSSAGLLTSVGVGVSDVSAHRRQKSPSPAGPSVLPASPSSSNASVKPGRRMKPIGTKPRPSKMVKMSSSISEREVEVAEVLFGLTRQFHTHHPAGESYAYSNANASKPDAKDSSNDGSVPPIYKVSSPLPSSSVVSSPISTSISPPPSSAALTLPHHSISAPTPPTAPKKKRPRPAKPEEASSASVMRPPVSVSAALTVPSIASGARNDIESGYQHAKMEISSVKSETDAFLPVSNPKGIPSVAATTCASSISASSNQVSTPQAPSNQTDGFIASEKTAAKYADLKSITTEKTSEAKISDLRMSTEKIADGHGPDLKAIPNDKAGGANSADAKFVTNENTVEPKAVESHSAEKSQFDASEDFKKSMPDVSEDQPDQIVKKELDVPDTDLPSCSDKKMGIANMLTQTPKAESIVEEKFKIDLMAPPEKSSFDTDDDSVPVAVSNVATEVPEATGVTVISEVMAVTVKEERHSNKWEEELKVEKTEKKYDKRDEGGEKILEKEHVIEQRGIDLQLDGENLENFSNKPLTQKHSRTPINEPKTEKEEKSVSEGVMGSNVCGSASVVTSMPISMTVPGWPGPLGYFAPAAANWAGATSLPGVLPIEGANSTPSIQPPYILQKSRPSWKRCATHSYIAHFIECQLRVNHTSFWSHANFVTSRQYNLNAPLPPSSEIINLGSSVSGTVSAASAGNNASVGRGLECMQDKSIGLTSLSSKEKTSNYVEARRKQTSHQQATQQISSTLMQSGHGFALSASQSGAVGGNSSTAGSTGNTGSLVKNGSTAVEAVPSCGAGPANSNLAGMSADAYMTMLQQGYSFAIPHFGAPYGGASNLIGQQQAQFFNTPGYATQFLHPPQAQPQPQSQRQGPQNPSTSSGSSSSQQHKQQFQGSRNFSSSQKQQQQGTASPSPSNSQQQHHMPMTPARHIDREANNEGDSPSTADSRIPVSQKTFYSPGSPTGSNYSATPQSLLPPGLPIQTQDLALFPPSGGKHNGKKQQQQLPPPQIQYAGYSFQQHLGSDPTFQMNLSRSQAQVIATMNPNSSVLCVPPMAQGHAMITDPGRHQMQVQAQQHAVQPGGTQAQHSGQMQRTQTISTGDGRNSIDSMSNTSGRGRDDERKSSMKGGIGHSLHFSRFETEHSTNMQGSPIDGSLPASIVTNNIESMSRTPNAISSAGNGNRNSRPTSSSSQGSPHLPSNQQLNQNTKQSTSRVKTIPSPNALPSVTSAQITPPSYGDRTPPTSNLNKLTASVSYPQNMKQGQQSPQWKMSSRMAMPPTMSGAVGASSQAIHAAEMKSSAQQGRNQLSNNNTGASAVTSSKNSGQASMNPKNNCTPIVAPKLSSSTPSVVVSNPVSSSSPVSKSVGSPSSRSPTGSKGPVSQQKSAISTSNKKSSPVGSRNMQSVLGPLNVSQSSSGKSGQQQYQQQSMPAMASGQPVNLKNQQYHNQQSPFYQPPQYLSQQAVQQSQHSAQTAHQVTGFHQKQQLPGSNSLQPAFNTAHLRQQVGQQQQIQLASSASSTPNMFTLGPLTLGGASGGSSKANPSGSLGGNSKGNTILHAQCSGQQQPGNPRAMLASPYMQAMSSKSSDQRVVADVLSQESINGNRMLQNSANLCTSAGQNRSPFNASPQTASVHVPPGSLKKSGGNATENLNSGGLSLSMAPSSSIRTNTGLTGSGNVGQNAKATAVSSAGMHSNQMPPMSIHQPSVPLAGGPATSASPGLHGQTAASAVQP